jgi:hypothetical protein
MPPRRMSKALSIASNGRGGLAGSTSKMGIPERTSPLPEGLPGLTGSQATLLADPSPTSPLPSVPEEGMSVAQAEVLLALGTAAGALSPQ